jgi:hypothetical protein
MTSLKVNNIRSAKQKYRNQSYDYIIEALVLGLKLCLFFCQTCSYLAFYALIT